MTDASQQKDLRTELEALFVNNADLARIHEHQSRFNPIRIMRMEKMEIRHSAILAWLLDPNETHGFGDKFTRAFIAEALKGTSSYPSAIAVAEADLRDAEVLREKSNIDILVSSLRNGWAFIIENKYHSKQHSDQLNRYRDHITKEASELGKTLKIIGILLSLDDDAPKGDGYVAINYSKVCRILTALLKSDGMRIDPQANQFIRDYLDIIMEATDMSEEKIELELLAKQLYRTHKKALDFIMEHGVSTEFTIAAELLFDGAMKNGDHKNLGFIEIMYNLHNQKILSFLPSGWVDALSVGANNTWVGCEKWGVGLPVTCWFRMNTKEDGKGGILFIFAEVGPLSDPAARAKLIDCIANCAQGENKKLIKFRADASKNGAMFSRFLNDNSTSIEDVNDADAILKGMQKLLKKFAPVFKAVETSLLTFSKHCEDHISHPTKS